MDLQQILGMLDHVTGPNSSGEYTARCPAHTDRTASLTVREKESPRDGKRRIYMHCHAGCSVDAIMEKLGITSRDLVVDPDERPQKVGGLTVRKAKADGPAGSPDVTRGDGSFCPSPDGQYTKRTVPGVPPDADGENKAPEKETLRPDWEHPDAVYSYTDQTGKEVFQVVRLHYLDGQPGKTFRQRIYDPKNPKATRSGYVNSVPAELRDVTLYKLPALVAGIRAGKTVYLVEGEKDVETLERLGNVATCNPGGAGKWRDGYTAWFGGADVVILPDNDPRGEKGSYAGQDHGWQVAMALRGVAKRVRLVNLKEACPELPLKGDISDMVDIMGATEAMDALARQVAATRDFSPEDVPFWLTPVEQCQRLYHQVPGGYDAENGCIVQHVGDAVKPLTDFVVIPRAELVRDDGVTKELFFVLDGYAGGSGKKLDRVTVSGADLDNMNWVSQKWGFAANILPGSTTKGKVAWAIKKVGQMTAKRVTEYSHTGWRRIGGQWAYLYQGGAVGADGVTVNLGEKLSTYRLDGGGSPEFRAMQTRDAIRRSLDLVTVMEERVALPILATMYLAPLREWMAQTDVAPAFALFLYGETGTHKSTAAALGMSHYGNFHSKNPPASFRDTSNAIREKAFYVKDMPLLVDDYYPTTSQQEKRTMASVAQNLSRAFGDGADRGRLQSDGQIKTSRPPRSVAVMTGEVLPDIGASGLARFFIVSIERGDIPITKDLTALQEDARKGVLQKAMRGYIQWLAKQADGMPERLHDMFIQFRDMARDMGKGSHDRTPEAVACLLMAYQMLLSYARDADVITTQEAGDMLVHGLRVLTTISGDQSRTMEEEKPSKIFLDTVGEALISGRAWVRDLQDPAEKVQPPTVRMIGWKDAENYYLLPKLAYGIAVQISREGGSEFPLNPGALWKQLRTEGKLAPGAPKELTRQKRLDGRNQRVLWIPKENINGRPETSEQQRMDMQAVERPEGMPENW